MTNIREEAWYKCPRCNYEVCSSDSEKIYYLQKIKSLEAKIAELEKLGCHCGESRRLKLTLKDMQSKLACALEALKYSNLGCSCEHESKCRYCLCAEKAIKKIEGE